ncbi:MAG: phosphoribosylamine--glycine ligase [Planctomycetota bacterium]|nr:MAG: phosphoribosylamine--glycine ligase [Planctomycetota bacterium]
MSSESDGTNVLVVGAGGREHAYLTALAASPDAGVMHAAPGNAGMAQLATCHDIAVDDVAGLVKLAKLVHIGLVVVGPEAPLVAGLVDALRAEGIPVLGPTREAAQLEASKAFCKDLCRRERIPTAAYRSFNSASEALAYVALHDRWPSVIKADGLAAGKGVVIVQDAEAATLCVRDMMLNERFGAAGERIVIEDFLEGEELSIIALVDGETVAVLEPSRDHKAAFDGDTGPNTGGMGAFSPTRLLTPRLYDMVEERVLIPTVHAMAKQGRPFTGFLYAGLMITADGPQVLEFNVRGGDPEMEVLMPRLESDALGLFLATATGSLGEHGPVQWRPEHACAVVLADGGYPGSTTPGAVIDGLDQAAARPDVFVYHAGTERAGRGKVITAGGRVLCVTALGKTLAQAQERAYAAVRCIDFPGMRCRSDIAWRELPRPDTAPTDDAEAQAL